MTNGNEEIDVFPLDKNQERIIRVERMKKSKGAFAISNAFQSLV